MNERSGFRSIKAEVRLDIDLSDEEKIEFLHEVDRRCPVSDSLMNNMPIEISLAD